MSDRITLIDHGRNVIDDTPAGLKRAIGGDRIKVVLQERRDLAAAQLLGRVTGAEPQIEVDELRVHASVTDRVRTLTEVTRTVSDAGIGVEDLGLRRPTLDEVFLHLTGHPTPADTPEGAAV